MRRLLMILLVLLTVTAAGCSFLEKKPAQLPDPPPLNEDEPEPEPRDQNLRETMFYLPDESRQVLIPVRIYIPWEEGIAKATLRYCTEGHVPEEAQRAGLVPLLPAGTTILGLSVKEGLARIDFSKEFLTYQAEHEELVLNGLTYTLTEFPTINKVTLLVEHEEPELPGESSLAEPLMREFGLNLEVDEGVEDFTGTQRITLYYLYDANDRAFYVPVTRVVKEPADWLTTLGDELMSGPKSGSVLFSAIPDGLTLHEVTQQGNKVTLHLEGEPVIEGGQAAADRLRQQVALTFTEIKGIEEVAVLLNGELPDFGPGISFPASFGRPKQWNLAD